MFSIVILIGFPVPLLVPLADLASAKKTLHLLKNWGSKWHAIWQANFMIPQKYVRSTSNSWIILMNFVFKITSTLLTYVNKNPVLFVTKKWRDIITLIMMTFLSTVLWEIFN